MVRLPLASIRPNPRQPRKRFAEESLKELADSIREKGLLQPLLVRPQGDGYELVAGERRYRAALMAGLQEVPAVVKDLTDREALELALVENLQREDLSPVEEARGYQALLEMGLTQEEVARRVGKARSTVANALRLLQLPPEALEALLQPSPLPEKPPQDQGDKPQDHPVHRPALRLPQGLGHGEADEEGGEPHPLHHDPGHPLGKPSP